MPAPPGGAAPARTVPTDASGPSPPRAVDRARPRCSACTSASTRCILKMASARATSRGNAARAFAVASPTTGVADQQQILRPRPSKRVGQCPVDLDDRVRPPARARRCPRALRRVAGAEQLRVAKVPVTRSNTLRPATVAAALLPSPAAIGMSLLVTSIVTLGPRLPACVAPRSKCALNRVPARTPAARSAPLRASFPHRRGHRRSGPQVQLDGNAKGIEAATQVGDRAWDYDFLPDSGVSANGLCLTPELACVGDVGNRPS